MQFWHFFLIFAATKSAVASPAGPMHQEQVDGSTHIDAIIAKYNLTDDGTAPRAEHTVTTRAVKCYSDDWRWDTEKSYTLDRAGRWCSGNGGAERYRRGQLKRGCYNLNNRKRVDFSIQNRQSRDIDLSSGLCFRFISGIINSCDRGGENGNNEWGWVADSNIGTC